MHFTLWAGSRSNIGAHAEVSWDTFLQFVASPTEAVDVDGLEGWSPVKFKDNARAKANVEAVSCIVLDDDKSGLSMDQVCALWGRYSGVVHTSRRHTVEKPRFRIVLRCSRDMTAAEHVRVWEWVRASAVSCGQTLDESTKDSSRLWFVPARLPGAVYEHRTLNGSALDVDALVGPAAAWATKGNTHEAVASSSSIEISPDRAYERRVAQSVDKNPNTLENVMRSPGPKPPASPAPTLGAARRAMAAALGAAWPEGGRHLAQLALAGALRAEGFEEAEAVDFLCEVCAAAGNEDRPKRTATVRHTYSREADAPTTGWNRLKSFVDPVVVEAARGVLGRGAAWGEDVGRRIEEARARALVSVGVAASEQDSFREVMAPVYSPHAPPPDTTVQAGPFVFKSGGLDADQPPIVWAVDTMICKADVVMLVAHGGSLKTWLAFSLAVAVARGAPWLGHYPTILGKVAILDFESGDYEVTRRLKMLGAKDSDGLLRVSYSPARLVDPESWVALAGLGLDLLIVDSYNAACPDLDENDARSAIMLQLAGRFANATGCTVIFIHHARKDSGGDKRVNVRGSTALFAACDRVFDFDVPEKRDGGIVVCTMTSSKDGAGRAPAPVKVELSDQGLKLVQEAVVLEKTVEEKNREIVLGALKAAGRGVKKKLIVDVMLGREQGKYALLSSMVLAGVLVETSIIEGRAKSAFLTLNEGAAK